MDVIELSKLVGAVIVILGALYSLNRYVIIPSIKIVRRVIRFVQKRELMYELVQSELNPNGGRSIKDTVSRIDRRMIISENRGAAIVKHTGMPLWETDHKGEWITVSRAVCDLVKRSPSDLLGNGWINCIAAGSREKVLTEWVGAVSQRRDFIMDFECHTPDGKAMTVHAEAYLVCGLDRADSRYVGMLALTQPTQK